MRAPCGRAREQAAPLDREAERVGAQPAPGERGVRSVAPPVAGTALDQVAADVARLDVGPVVAPDPPVAARSALAGAPPASVWNAAIAVPQRKPFGKSRAAAALGAASARTSDEQQREEGGTGHGARQCMRPGARAPGPPLMLGWLAAGGSRPRTPVDARLVQCVHRHARPVKRGGRRCRWHRGAACLRKDPACGTTALTLALLAGAPAPAGAHHTVEGTLTGVHADYFDKGSSVTRWRLQTGDRTVDVLPTSLPALSPEHAAVAVDDEDRGAGVAGPVTAAAPQAGPTLGGRKTAVIAFNFATDLRQPWTPAQIKDAIFTGAESTSAFFREESYDKLWLAGKAGNPDGDVFGWVTLPVARRATCDYSSWARDAKVLAAASGFSASGYQHVMYVFPKRSSCGWAGLAYMPGTESWINGDLGVRVTGHELSHNLGLHHAGSWACTGTSGQAVAISSNCTLSEYNDPFDVMGAHGRRHSHGWNLQRLGLLQAVQRPDGQRVRDLRDQHRLRADDPADDAADPAQLRRQWRGEGLVLPGDSLAGRDLRQLLAQRLGRAGREHPRRRRPVTDHEIAADRHPPGRRRSSTPRSSPARRSATATSASRRSRQVPAPPASRSTLPPRRWTPSRRPRRGPLPRAARRRRAAVLGGSGDNIAVDHLRVYRDGVQVGSSSSTSFDDTTALPGSHVYTVYARDAAGNVSPASAPYVVVVPAKQTSALKTRRRATGRARGCA